MISVYVCIVCMCAYLLSDMKQISLVCLQEAPALLTGHTTSTGVNDRRRENIKMNIEKMVETFFSETMAFVKNKGTSIHKFSFICCLLFVCLFVRIQ